MTRARASFSWQFYLGGDITEESVQPFVEAAWEENRDAPTLPWQIVINTSGGDLEAGSALFDTIRSYSKGGSGTHEVTTIVRGRAYSMGAYLTQAGDVRKVSNLSMVMFHEPYVHVCDTGLTVSRAYLDAMAAWQHRMLDLCAERATVGRDELAGLLMQRDRYFLPEELVELGLMDGIE